MATELEIWKDIPNYEGIYQCSNHGHIRNLKFFRILKDGSNPNLYPSVSLYKGNKRTSTHVHKVLMTLFKDNHENFPQINHINGKKRDNRLENLEWCSASHNINHAFRTGLNIHRVGFRTHCKLDETQAKTIKKCLSDGVQSRVLAKYFNINESVVCSIKIGRTWRDI